RRVQVKPGRRIRHANNNHRDVCIRSNPAPLRVNHCSPIVAKILHHTTDLHHMTDLDHMTDLILLEHPARVVLAPREICQLQQAVQKLVAVGKASLMSCLRTFVS
ncbi:MAG: hypothetical protein CMQ33_13120, partial [Gammaproteobacteria bacterium]|nr:hypothetical protein [Gammaproteobacteria bacterium]